MAKNCPKRERLNAIQESEGEENAGGSSTSRVNPLQLLNTVSTVKSAPNRGLLYAAVQLNGKTVKALLDTGATSNFLSNRMVDKLGLVVNQSPCKIKAVNSGATPVQVVATMTLKVGA